ncbi:MAG: TldD/PmbA family protein [Armatimonadota bacterium]
MKDRLHEALKRSTADYAEIRFETLDTTGLGYRGTEVEQASTSCHAGGIVRACTKGGWGLATFETLDDLPRKVEEACRCAALVGKETTQLADAGAPEDAIVRAELVRDFRGVPLDEKLKLVTDYNNVILKTDPAIESTRVMYNESFRTVHYASSQGAYYQEERPRVTLMLMAVARDGALVQRAHDSVSSAIDYGVVLGQEATADDVARRAVALLTAPMCDGGTCTVLLNQALAGVFAHEAFGHLSEADFLYENPQMRELMYLGRPMGVQALNIVDDGSLGRTIGTQCFDDEGTPTGKTDLIRDGMLAGHLHSRETAAKMGARPTGNARAEKRDMPPVVRMTNTYIEAGEQSFDALLSGIDRGIYALDMIGGQTMLEMFTFSAAYGYRIENGQVGELIRDVTLSGNVFETLHRIDGFGNDLLIRETGGMCGKNGQAAPVTFGSPHLRVRDVVVGGK